MIVEICNIVAQFLEILHSVWWPFCFSAILVNMNLTKTDSKKFVLEFLSKYDQI